VKTTENRVVARAAKAPGEEMLTDRDKTPWDSHDWKVKTLESLTTGGGSRLGFTCRSCQRKFSYTTTNHRAWAVNDDGKTLSDDITSRWLSERCLRRPAETDNEDRQHLKYPR
jgi:transposase-like protein